MSRKSANPLPLSDILRDLAVLRASDIDLSKAVPVQKPESGSGEYAESLARSYEFVQQARQTIRMMNKGDVDKQGSRIDDARHQLEEIEKGLEGAQ
jgi:hypothetical protein